MAVVPSLRIKKNKGPGSWSDNRSITPSIANAMNAQTLAGDISHDLRSLPLILGAKASAFFGFSLKDSQSNPIDPSNPPSNNLGVDQVSLPTVEHLNQAIEIFNKNLAKGESLKVPIKYYWIETAYRPRQEYLYRFAYDSMLPISKYGRQYFHDITGHGLQAFLSPNFFVKALQIRIKLVFEAEALLDKVNLIFQLLNRRTIAVDDILNSQLTLRQFLQEKQISDENIPSIISRHTFKLASSKPIDELPLSSLLNHLDLNKQALDNLVENQTSEQIQSYMTEWAKLYYKDMLDQFLPSVDNWGNVFSFFADTHSIHWLFEVGKKLNSINLENGIPTAPFTSTVNFPRHGFLHPREDHQKAPNVWDVLKVSFDKEISEIERMNLDKVYDDIQKIKATFDRKATAATATNDIERESIRPEMSETEFFGPGIQRLAAIEKWVASQE